MLERETESARTQAGRADGPGCWAALTRASERGRRRVAAGPFGWAEPEEGREAARVEFLFFFFKNVNGTSICLFRLKFYRAPKLVKIFV
jgi:hypothetical protein